MDSVDASLPNFHALSASDGFFTAPVSLMNATASKRNCCVLLYLFVCLPIHMVSDGQVLTLQNYGCCKGNDAALFPLCYGGASAALASGLLLVCARY